MNRSAATLAICLAVPGAIAPGALRAVPLPVYPECTDPDGTEYYRTQFYYGGFVLSEVNGPSGDTSIRLLACVEAQSLTVDAAGAAFDSFVVHGVIDAMSRSSEAYSFAYMAGVFRGQGLRATIGPMSVPPCVCALR